ncbi:MAG: DUF3099 domain-containing protein [Nocardioides alkalitolerans]|jgi:hypothetical protein
MPSLRRTSSKDEPVRITTAQTAPDESLDSRQRRYIFAMAVRTLCVVGAYAVGPGWLRWVLLSGAVFLPWFAVVAANVTSQRSDGFEVEAVDAPALPAGGQAIHIEAGDWVTREERDPA